MLLTYNFKQIHTLVSNLFNKFRKLFVFVCHFKLNRAVCCSRQPSCLYTEGRARDCHWLRKALVACVWNSNAPVSQLCRLTVARISSVPPSVNAVASSYTPRNSSFSHPIVHLRSVIKWLRSSQLCEASTTDQKPLQRLTARCWPQDPTTTQSVSHAVRQNSFDLFCLPPSHSNFLSRYSLFTSPRQSFVFSSFLLVHDRRHSSQEQWRVSGSTSFFAKVRHHCLSSEISGSHGGSYEDQVRWWWPRRTPLKRRPVSVRLHSVKSHNKTIQSWRNAQGSVVVEKRQTGETRDPS